MQSAASTDDDRALLERSIQRLLERHWPAAQAPARAADPVAVRECWRLLADLGLSALGASSSRRDLKEVLLGMESLGRAGCPAPMLNVALTNLALADQAAASPAVRSFLEGIRSAEFIPCIAWGKFDGDSEAGHCRRDGDRIEGEFALLDGMQGATHLVVMMGGAAGIAVAELDQAGAEIRATPGLSVPALYQASLTMASAYFTHSTDAALADLAWLARLGLVARALGAARRGFELAVDYAKARKQFGQPIGRFQAIQHKLADCFIAIEGSKLLLAAAAEAWGRHDEAWRLHCASAFAYAGPALRQVALEVQHTVGAIGFSEEHELPRHFRRVHVDLARLGGVRHARNHIADMLFRSPAGGTPQLDLGQAANAFRQEVRNWLAVHWDAGAQNRHRAQPFERRGFDPAFSQELGKKGWIAVSWPQQYGGQNRSPLEQFAFVEEMSYAGAPTAAHTCGAELVGPALIAFGTPEQKARFLPAFLRGESTFCLGYSESEAGSDLAALRTTAVRDGDRWLINGEKLWTTMGDRAEYHWLAVRTDPHASPPHAGISVFMVPLASAGITIRPSMAMYGHTFCAVRYDNVSVPDTARVGEINGGWKVITHALASERVLMGAHVANVRRVFDDLLRYLAHVKRDGRPMSLDPVARDRIAALAAELEAARQLAVNGVRVAQQGRLPVYEAAMSKVYSGELMQRICEAAIDLIGATAILSEDSRSAPLDGAIEQTLRRSIMMVVGGGTAQIQRTLIAQRGLMLPR